MLKPFSTVSVSGINVPYHSDTHTIVNEVTLNAVRMTTNMERLGESQPTFNKSRMEKERSVVSDGLGASGHSLCSFKGP